MRRARKHSRSPTVNTQGRLPAAFYPLGPFITGPFFFSLFCAILSTQPISMRHFLLPALLLLSIAAIAQQTEKPPLHGNHWMAVTGKPLAAEAGAQIFQ